MKYLKHKDFKNGNGNLNNTKFSMGNENCDLDFINVGNTLESSILPSLVIKCCF